MPRLGIVASHPDEFFGRDALGAVIDSEEDAPLNEIARTAMDGIKHKCAHWRGELEVASWIAERGPEGFSVRGCQVSVEQAEEGGGFSDSLTILAMR